MATPVKSPLQKKHRGDEPLSEDVIITGVSDGVERGAVSLEAIEKLLDRKLDPLSQFLQRIHLDLSAFKESVRVEFESMGLRLSETENQVSETMARVQQLEQEISKLKKSDGIAAQRQFDITKSLTMMIGNIPKASSLDDAKAWLEKHYRTIGISPPSSSDVYKKSSDSNLVFVKCQSESHQYRRAIIPDFYKDRFAV